MLINKYIANQGGSDGQRVIWFTAPHTGATRHFTDFFPWARPNSVKRKQIPLLQQILNSKGKKKENYLNVGNFQFVVVPAGNHTADFPFPVGGEGR